jgi:hypothetical protein
MIKINKSSFRSWLKNNQKLKFRPSNYCYCPLATFLTIKSGKVYKVGKTICWTENMTLGVHLMPDELPQWAIDFVEKIDKSEAEYVTSTRCLKILEQV